MYCLLTFTPHGQTLFRTFSGYLVSFPFKPSYSWSVWLWSGGHHWRISSRRCLPLTNAMDVEQTYEGSPQEPGSICFETTIERFVDVHAIVQKWNSYCFVSRPYPKQFSRKVLRSLTSAVQDESMKTTKIMHLKNLALYGISHVL